MSSPPKNFFITSEELIAVLDRETLRLVDASWYLPAMNRDGKEEFEKARIRGAQYFDIDTICETASDLPHMLPSPEGFASAVGTMGICESDEIVIYDGPGLFSSARVWWMFKLMGAENVRILAGGFDGWKTFGNPIETGPAQTPQPASFKTEFNADAVSNADDMLANIRRGETLVLDARPFGRFTGEVPEPRAGLRSGHIPGSKSLPASDVIREGRLLPQEELGSVLETIGVRAGTQVTTTCGSGVTAAILTLALETIGHEGNSLYDGSWADWGARGDVPIARWE